MGTSDVFKTFVEPSLERIPVLEVSHVERHQKRDYVVTQTIQRNVFTDFDRKLSRHLAATRGAGFPAFTVAVRVNERGCDGPPRYLTPVHHASVPHALKGIADRAFARCGRVDLTVHNNNPGAGDRVVGVRRKVDTEDIETLDAALKICRHLGEVVSLIVVLFFSYGIIFNQLKWKITYFQISHEIFLIPFLAIIILGFLYCLKTKRKLNNITTILNVVAISIFAVSLAQLITYDFNANYIFEDDVDVSTKFHLNDNLDEFPDIYYIILDEYAGSKILYDKSPNSIYH